MKVFMTSGEPSGDALGAALITGLRALRPDIELRGVAGPRMQAAGMTSLFPMEELSVMGIAEVLPKYRQLKRRIGETAQAALAWHPDVVVTIDSPDFSLRVAKRVKARSAIRTVHYVAPTVWAWRPGRASKMARVIDHVLALFPFEPPYMEAAGMACDFVGHPVAALPPMDTHALAATRQDLLKGRDRLLTLLPGSRRSEVARLLPIFAEAVAQSPLRDAAVVLPTLPHLEMLVQELAQPLPVPPTILAVDGEEGAQVRRMAYHAADLALAASGTVSLELAEARTPMVIAYDMNWLSRQIIQRKLLIDTVTLVNLVSDTRAVPEFIGAGCRPEAIAEGLANVAAHPDAQRSAMACTLVALGQDGPPPGHRAAEAILARLLPG